MNKLRWLAVACTLIGGFEGLSLIAYRDPVGIPTACFGETKNIRMGQKFSMAQCEAMLQHSVQLAGQAVQRCVNVPLPDARRAALVSLTYNIGAANFCGSTLVRKLNAGDTVGACQQFHRWKYAKGIELPGLVRRRAEEAKLCMQDLT